LEGSKLTDRQTTHNTSQTTQATELLQASDSASSQTTSSIIEQLPTITMDYDSGNGIVSQTDDVLTITTSESLQSADLEELSESTRLKETNLNQPTTSENPAFEPDSMHHTAPSESADSMNQPGTSQGLTVEPTTLFSHSLPSTPALLIQKSRPGVTLDSEDQSSSHSIPSNLSAPALDRAVPRSKRGKHNLHSLLHFVATTEKARVSKKENFTKDHVMNVSMCVCRKLIFVRMVFSYLL